MKIKIHDYDNDKIEVPESIAQPFIKWCSKENMTNHRASKNCETCEVVVDAMVEYASNMLDESKDKLIPEEHVDFLSEWESNRSFHNGGGPIYDEMTFKVGKQKFTVVAFGWEADADGSDCYLYMLAYKKSKKL